MIETGANASGLSAQVLNKRLRPLYLGTFLQSFVLWYGIEKLFMHDIGFASAQIALAGIFLSMSLAVFQFPTGILADRWSRKGMLIVASCILFLSTVTGALSRNVPTYYITSVLWGLFASIRVGTYDAIIYDALHEETGGSEGFEHYFGRVKLINSAGFVSSALLSGVSAQVFGIRETYWISTPTILLSILVLVKFRDPLFHKAHGPASVMSHSIQTLKAVVQRGEILWFVVPALLFGVISRITINLSQLWYIPLALPTVYWGPAFAALELGDGLAGPIASRIKGKRVALLTLAVLTIVSALALVLHASLVLIIFSQATLLAGSSVFSIILGRRIHDAVPSPVRAGASSTVGTLSMILFLPVAYIFGWISDRYTVFRGAWVIAAITVLALAVFCFRVLPKHGTFRIAGENVLSR